MNLFEIQNALICDRTDEAWYRIRVAGSNFHYRWQWGTGADGGFSYIMGEHRGYAVSREQAELTMAWGMEIDPDERYSTPEWAEGEFVNPTIHGFWVDFFWCGALIDRVELARVDGGHGVVPWPHYDDAGGLQVTDFEVAVAYLVHDLEGGENHDHPGRYVDQLGFRRVPDEDRQGAGTGN